MVDDMTTRTGIDASAEPPFAVLAELRRLRAERGELERREATLVRRARNEGVVWEQIAACLDVSKQAVHKKHAGRLLRRR
jgi:hypothetical protein